MTSPRSGERPSSAIQKNDLKQKTANKPNKQGEKCTAQNNEGLRFSVQRVMKFE